MKSKKLILIVASLLSAVFILTLRAQTSAFTYQGRLTDSSGPATGIYDLRFTIYDAGTGGNVVAGPVTNSAVAVTNGLFTTTLDFGAGVFNGSDRWLEIGVATNGSGGFTSLSPRQLVTSTPYAIQAANAASAAVAASASSVSAVNITGTLATTQLPTSVVTNGASGVNITGTFSGDGSGVTNVPGTMPWQSAGGTNITATANQAYLLTNAALETVTLPNNATVGDVVTVSGTGSTGWQVAAGTGQSIPGYSSVWTDNNNAPSATWASVASSADGAKLVAVIQYQGIYTSTDSGVTWTNNNNAPLTGWDSVASSADGTKLVAVVYGGGIYTSANSGVTWSANNNAPSPKDWWSVASSADGARLVAVVYGGGIYTSTNSGVTWSDNNNAPSNIWLSVASSADGTKLVAVGPGGIWTSTDSGVTWTDNNNAPSEGWESVASSADGTKLVAVGSTVSGTIVYGGIWTSTNSGVTWSANNNAPTTVEWRSVASSADGTKLVAVSDGKFEDYEGRAYTSTDSGVTWSANNDASPTNYWLSVASSADGSKLVAVVQGGGIWTSDPYYHGTPGTTVQYQYLGNGIWQPVGQPASRIVGTLSPSQLPSNLVTNGESGVTLGSSFSGTFSGNGSGLTGLNAANLTGSVPAASLTSVPAASLTGTVPDTRLSSNVALRSGGNAFTGTQTFTGGNVGIGTTTPSAALQVAGSGFFGGDTGGLSASAGPGVRIYDDSSLQEGQLFAYNYSNSTPQNLVLQGSGGLVAIGSTIALDGTNGDIYTPGYITCLTLSQTSDRNAKRDFTAINPGRILQKVAALPITEWQYKAGPQGVEHLGPMAQDFHAAFGLNGSDNKHITTVDEGGVALAAIQGLNEKVEAGDQRSEARSQRSEVRIQQLQAENTELRQKLNQVVRTVNQLSQEIHGGAR